MLDGRSVGSKGSKSSLCLQVYKIYNLIIQGVEAGNNKKRNGRGCQTLKPIGARVFPL